MNRSLLAVAMVALGGISSISYAAENPSGVYLGAGVGQFNVQIDDINQTDNAIQRLDDNDAAWKAFVGYRFNPYIALEAAYIDLGKPNGRSCSPRLWPRRAFGNTIHDPLQSMRFRS